jgi:hypothetical protein
MAIDLGADTAGQNYCSSLRPFRLMSTKLDLSARLATLIRDITNGECSDFSDSQAGIDGQDESQTIAFGMSRGLDDSEDAPNFVVRKDGLEP